MTATPETEREDRFSGYSLDALEHELRECATALRGLDANLHGTSVYGVSVRAINWRVARVKAEIQRKGRAELAQLDRADDRFILGEPPQGDEGWTACQYRLQRRGEILRLVTLAR